MNSHPRMHSKSNYYFNQDSRIRVKSWRKYLIGLKDKKDREKNRLQDKEDKQGNKGLKDIKDRYKTVFKEKRKRYKRKSII